jgi:hypothetical protein
VNKIALTIFASALMLAGCAKNDGTEAVQPKRGFELTFSEDFKPGMNMVDDIGISIVLVVDVSGSMTNRPESGGRPKYIQAANALETVSNYLASLAEKERGMKVNVAVIKFSNEVYTVLPLTELNGEGISLMKQACVPANFEPRDGTAIGLGLQKGSEILAQSGTIFNSMILVTDGDNTISPDPLKVMGAIYSNRNNKSRDDRIVRTSTQLISFIGFDIDSPMFAKFHSLGARVTSAGNQAELEESLKSLLEADITKLEGN